MLRAVWSWLAFVHGAFFKNYARNARGTIPELIGLISLPLWLSFWMLAVSVILFLPFSFILPGPVMAAIFVLMLCGLVALFFLALSVELRLWVQARRSRLAVIAGDPVKRKEMRKRRDPDGTVPELI